jgi:hypothetical protein
VTIDFNILIVASIDFGSVAVCFDSCDALLNDLLLRPMIDNR